jgi:hypothetical protein
MSTRIAAKGAIVKWALTATPTNVLPGVREVGITIGSRPMIDATAHDDSTTKSMVAAVLRDTNAVDVKLAYDPANAGHEAVRAAQAGGTLHYVTVVLPDVGAAEWAMSGYWTDFSVPALNPDTGLLEATAKFKAIAADTFTQ